MFEYVSQINLLVQSIKGDNEEGLKIQQEAGEVYLKILESTPVVGQGMAAGYAIAGDLVKAEGAALGATKCTSIAAATVGCGLATGAIR